MRTFKKYASFQCFMAMAACIMLLALSGCGGGKASSTTGTSLSAPVTEKQKALQAVEQVPYLKTINLSGKLNHKGGKFSLAATATRSATTVTRTLMGSSVAGDCCAFVYAMFELTGTLTFNALDGTVVGTKDIDMFAYGNYELVKDAATGDWVIIKNAVDGLIFSQGYSPYIQGVTTNPFGPYMPGDTFNLMVTVQPYNYGNELYVSGQSITAGQNTELLDDGVSPDTMAADYTYSGAITVPSTAVAGDEYVSVMDVMDTTASFNLTETGIAGQPYVYPYSGSLMVHQGVLGTADTFTSAAISCEATEVPAGGATHCVVDGVLSDGTTKELDAGDVEWSVSSGSAYVSEGGIVIPYMEGELVLSAQVKEGPSAGTIALSVVTPTTTFTAAELSAPTGVTATAGDGQIVVSWDAATDALGYNVDVWQITNYDPDEPAPGDPCLAAGNCEDLNPGVIDTADNNADIFDDQKDLIMQKMGVFSPVVLDGLTNGTTYYVVVTSLGISGESAESTEVTATPEAGISSVPSAPLNVTATETAEGEVTVSWDAVDGATYYNVYMAAEAGVLKDNYATLTDGMLHAGITSSPYVHTSLNPGFTYYFVVTAGNELGESNESAEAYAATTGSTSGGGTGGPISAPSTVSESSSSGQVTLYWSPSDGAVSYNVYIASVTGVTAATYSTLADGAAYSGITTSTYEITGLTNGTTYYIVVTAVDVDGAESVESTEVTSTPIGFVKLKTSWTGLTGKAVAFTNHLETFVKNIKI